MIDPAVPALSPAEWAFLGAHRVARLATVAARARPHLVPVCFAVDGHAIYSALDEKPKRVPPTRLQRVRNLLANPAVALLVDDYAEDWTTLAYLSVDGQADLVETGDAVHARAIGLLRAKYPQYARMAIDRQPVIRIIPRRAHWWSSAGV